MTRFLANVLGAAIGATAAIFLLALWAYSVPLNVH
jgi:uncharacterized membrane protein YccC